MSKNCSSVPLWELGNCSRNDSQGYFPHEGLAVQIVKDETQVAVWITALVAFLTFRLLRCFFLPDVSGVWPALRHKGKFDYQMQN